MRRAFLIGLIPIAAMLAAGGIWWRTCRSEKVVIEDLFIQNGKPVAIQLARRSGSAKKRKASTQEWLVLFTPDVVGATARVDMEDGSVLEMKVQATDRSIGNDDVSSGQEEAAGKLVTYGPTDQVNWLANLTYRSHGGKGVFVVRQLPDGQLGLTLLSKRLYGGRFQLACVVPNPHFTYPDGSIFPCLELQLMETKNGHFDGS